MPIDFAALRIELLTGSFASLYSAARALGDYNRLTDLVNTTNANGANSTVTIGTVNALTLQQCVVAGEFTSITQAQRDLWQCIVTTATTGIAISNTTIRQQITTIWSATTTTRANLISAQTRFCSRGETLFGENVIVDTTAIYVALTQP